MTTRRPLLVAEHLTRRFASGSMSDRLRGRGGVTALDDVSITVHAGERLGVVGESGSGKTTLMRLLLGLEAPDHGQVTYDGRPVACRGRQHWYRRKVQLVPQDPSSSLNPQMRVLDAVAEPLRCLQVDGDHGDRAAECLELVGLPAHRRSAYAGELSGGERQRVAIARALAPRPEIVVADEAVSALDASVRLHVLRTLRRICDDTGVGLVFVSHDLGSVFHLCDTVAVLHHGVLVETGPVDDVFTAPRHDTTRRLLDAVPRPPADAVCAVSA